MDQRACDADPGSIIITTWRARERYPSLIRRAKDEENQSLYECQSFSCTNTMVGRMPTGNCLHSYIGTQMQHANMIPSLHSHVTTFFGRQKVSILGDGCFWGLIFGVSIRIRS